MGERREQRHRHCRRTRRGKGLRPCWALADVTKQQGERNEPMRIVQLWSLSTGKQTSQAAVVNSGMFRKGGGLFLNFCPFCGVDIRTPEDRARVGAESEGV